MTTDTPGAAYGTAPQARIPSAMVTAGFYEASPAALRPDGTRPRPLFDVTTEEGRSARDAYLADAEATAALKDAAYARRHGRPDTEAMQAEIASVLRNGGAA